MKIERKCKWCKNSFLARTDKNNFYCSRKCYILYKEQNLTNTKCLYCNKKFIIGKYELENNYGKYCRQSCREKDAYTNITCIHCKKNFLVRKLVHQKNKTKFCSLKCFNENKCVRVSNNCLNCNKIINTTKNKTDKGCSKFCCKKCYTIYQPKLVAELISSGKLITPSSKNFKSGFYVSSISNVKEYYNSSYELKRMIDLDKVGKIWTKRHKISIEYIGSDNKKHRYIPDFLVGDDIIEEVKPKTLVNSNYLDTKLKIKAGKKFCKKSGYKYKIITEKELGIKI